MFTSIITANIKTLNDVWIVGDDFLKDITHSLQDLKIKASAANKALPYIYERYNISLIYKSPLTSDAYSRILTAFTNAMNKKFKLPKYVIVVPDKDLLQEMNYFNFGISRLLGITTNWLAKQFEWMIYTR